MIYLGFLGSPLIAEIELPCMVARGVARVPGTAVAQYQISFESDFIVRLVQHVCHQGKCWRLRQGLSRYEIYSRHLKGAEDQRSIGESC